ncbi:adhesin transport system membrane fusion protein [Paraburkholderia sp. BL8N3]|jgi:adhesin transport system membrane fusion protein|nr:HlyD family type I secretion periplasmic adaptor subunit [Paraburkholderia sp. BL8N3]TCK44703.1 adhesin transport system membrane fusion protein [Paraburkholderia sp. BL8N3]
MNLPQLFRKRGGASVPVAGGRRAASRIHPADAAYMNDLRESQLAQSIPGTRAVLYLLAAVIAGGLVWAKFARVEEITHGEGKVIPVSREQLIQSLEGGILADLHVREGDVVQKGQLLLNIDPKRADSAYSEGRSKLVGLRGTVARLRAEAFGQALAFPPDVLADKSVVQSETLAYQARRKALYDSVASLERSYGLAMNEINMTEPLAKRGLISETEVLRMKRSANDLQAQIVERRNKYQADANEQLSRLELELAQTKENLVGRADVLQRTTIVAPVKGTVKDIKVTTVGGVIQPGAQIMSIVPYADQLIVEARVKPQDVAFLRPGLPATVKISAYDFGIYGGLKGHVKLISPDTLQDDHAAPGKPDAIYYRVQVLTENSELVAGGKRLPIIPGMTGTVEIRTGEKTVLSYLLKPIFKAREAFRER